MTAAHKPLFPPPQQELDVDAQSSPIGHRDRVRGETSTEELIRQPLAAGDHVFIVTVSGPADEYDRTVNGELRHPPSCDEALCAIALEVTARPGELRLPDWPGAYRMSLVDDLLNLPSISCVELPEE